MPCTTNLYPIFETFSLRIMMGVMLYTSSLVGLTGSFTSR